jgi:hypothetical protein
LLPVATVPPDRDTPYHGLGHPRMLLTFSTMLAASIFRKRLLVAALAILAVAAISAALVWFAPHKLFIDARANDVAPSQGAVLSEGAFRSLEHETRGSAAIVEMGDRKRIVRLRDLATSNGPELHVYLSSVAPQDDWFVYDDGPHLDLGPLKGNLGSSNYDIPPDVDLAKFRSVVVWCRRFSVGFGVAPLNVKTR